jgi:hypothetical protein
MLKFTFKKYLASVTCMLKTTNYTTHISKFLTSPSINYASPHDLKGWVPTILSGSSDDSRSKIFVQPACLDSSSPRNLLTPPPPPHQKRTETKTIVLIEYLSVSYGLFRLHICLEYVENIPIFLFCMCRGGGGAGEGEIRRLRRLVLTINCRPYSSY